MSEALGTKVTVRDTALSEAPEVAGLDAGLAWLVTAGELVARTQIDPALFACIRVPPANHAPNETNAVIDIVRASPAFKDRRVSIVTGERFEARLSETPCVDPVDAGEDARSDAP